MPALRTQAVICTLEEYKAPDLILRLCLLAVRQMIRAER